jgi:leucyl aminopeptidase (aminopeptidase T)
MKVYLDGRPLTVPQPVTMSSALRAATVEAGRAGRVIVEVEVDGSPAAESLLEDPPEEAVGEEVKMVSVEPRSLVRVTLMDAADALDSARQRQTRCAELIQIGKIDEALAPLSEAIQTWQTVRDAVEKSAAMLGMELRELGGGADEHGLDELVTVLAERLGEVRRSLSGEDWSALADVLAYDMGEQADRWKVALNAAADGLRPAR